MSIASTATRVTRHTDPEVNRQIRQGADIRIAYYRQHPERIDSRLEELDQEWDIERWLATNSSLATLLGMTLGFTRSRWWFLLPVAVQGFYLQHALQGWCPPLPVFRRLGIRTHQEIEDERHELLQIRDRSEASGTQR